MNGQYRAHTDVSQDRTSVLNSEVVKRRLMVFRLTPESNHPRAILGLGVEPELFTQTNTPLSVSEREGMGTKPYPDQEPILSLSLDTPDSDRD